MFCFSWAYIILYLTILCVSLVGNAIFCLIIKRCPNLHRTHHFFFLGIAIMDIFICLLAIPFVIDSQSKRQTWRLPEFLCKFYIFADYGLKGVHAYLLLLGSLFLFFWYRKNESYATETGEIRTRKTKMHKWAIPLAWVLGLGIGVPAGAMATMDNCGRCEVWHSIRAGQPNMAVGNEANVQIAFLVGAFLVPMVLIVLPLIALFMQLCGARSPRLDTPHSRTATLMVIFVVLLIASRAPHDIYDLMRMYSNQFGNMGNMQRHNPYGPSIETQMALDCMVYIPMLLHPVLLLLLQPEYRQGLRDALRSCGGSSPSRESPYGQGKERKFPAPAPIIRGGGRRYSKNGSLIKEQQPMIMPAGGGMAMHTKPMPGYPHPAQGGAYIQPKGSYIPMQMISPQGQPLLDNSFEEQPDPTLPARLAISKHSCQYLFTYFRFTSGNFQYIDTARVEPKIAYTPTNTPPKTPQIPHFDVKPFKQPNYVDGVWQYPDQQDAYTGNMPAHMIPVEGFVNQEPGRMIQPPVEQASSPPPDEPMEIECLDSSPGNTMRSSRRGRPLEGPPGVNKLQNSPGARRRNDGGRLEDAPPKNGMTNGHKSQPSSPVERPPSAGGQTVEITLQGRSRSRQDLCPDPVRPKSRFEHAV